MLDSTSIIEDTRNHVYLNIFHILVENLIFFFKLQLLPTIKSHNCQTNSIKFKESNVRASIRPDEGTSKSEGIIAARSKVVAAI